MVIPRILAAIEEMYAPLLVDADPYMLYLITAVVSVGQFSMVVFAGKGAGFFGPAGEDKLGTPAAPVNELEYIQGDSVDVQKPGQVKIVEFWATWCAPCKKVHQMPFYDHPFYLTCMVVGRRSRILIVLSRPSRSRPVQINWSVLASPTRVLTR